MNPLWLCLALALFGGTNLIKAHSDGSGLDTIRFVGSYRNGDSGTLKSPGFPDRYPSGPYAKSFHIEDTTGGLVKLTFEDFILSENYLDRVEIRDGPNRTSELYYMFSGTSRPHVVVSSGSSLWVEFIAVSQREQYFAVGFKAIYEFIGSNNWDNLPEVAGQFYHDPSQQLFFSSFDMYQDKEVDVIWTIKAPENHQVWVRFNISLSYLTLLPSVVLREGLTSEDPLITRVHALSGVYQAVSASNAMFIRLKTRMKAQLDFVWGLYVEFIYVDPIYKQCPLGYFLCQNNDKCINSTLTCDGTNHCGDWGDETLYDINTDCHDKCGGCYHGYCSCYHMHHGELCECYCDAGYHGSHCESETIVNPVCPTCQNSGYCDEIKAECLCPDNYYGNQCQYYYSDDGSYYMVLYACGGLIGLLLTCMCSLALTKRNHRLRVRRSAPPTISASGITEADYSQTYHQFNSDTERLTDPGMFFDMDAPPAYSTCVNTEGAVNQAYESGENVSPPPIEDLPITSNTDIPDEPPPSYEESTCQVPMVENNNAPSASASSEGDGCHGNAKDEEDNADESHA